MDHAESMGVREGGYHVAQNAHGVGNGEFTLAGDAGPERLPGDERHDEVGKALGFAGGKERHDVRMLELGGKLDLAAEPLDVDGGGELGQKHLHHDFAAQRPFVSDENPRHSAAAQLALQQVDLAHGELQLVLKAGAHGIEVGRIPKCRERD
jgi:hypothetical protein